jgi:hypothetical protein
MAARGMRLLTEDSGKRYQCEPAVVAKLRHRPLIFALMH